MSEPKVLRFCAPRLTNNKQVASNFLQIIKQLNDNHVDFVIVGGVAAALHGGTRVTFDLDIVPSLAPASWAAAVNLLWSLGARPRIPANLQQLIDVEQIRRWQNEKGMLALNFRNPDGQVEVDLLVSQADRFDQLKNNATPIELAGKTVYVAAIDDLIAMKRQAGRPQDLLDVEQLLAIKARRSA